VDLVAQTAEPLDLLGGQGRLGRLGQLRPGGPVQLGVGSHLPRRLQHEPILPTAPHAHPPRAHVAYVSAESPLGNRSLSYWWSVSDEQRYPNADQGKLSSKYDWI